MIAFREMSRNDEKVVLMHLILAMKFQPKILQYWNLQFCSLRDRPLLNRRPIRILV